MSSHRSHYERRMRPEEYIPPSSEGIKPTTTRAGAPSSGIPLPSRTQPSKAQPSFFSRNKSATVERERNTERLAAEQFEQPLELPRGQSSLSNRSQESSAKSVSTSSHSFGFRSLANSTKSPKEKEKPRNVLRRKAPSIDQRSAGARSRARSDASTSSGKQPHASNSLEGYKDPYPDTVFGVPIPQSSIPTMRPASHQEPFRSIIPELSDLSTNIPPRQNPPTPAISATVSSPSTRYSDSPGPWSRTSTPTSLSSYSPGIVQTTKIGHRTRLPSPTKTRPPVTRRKGNDVQQQERLMEGGQGLPLLRESVTSSSSRSTVKGVEGIEKDASVKRYKKLLTPPPPSPPPRKSSTKFKSPKRRENDDGDDPSQSSFNASHNEAAEPTNLQKIRNPPEFAHLRTVPPSPSQDIPPSRPSREGTEDLDIKPSPIIQSSLSPLQIGTHKRRESFDRPVAEPQLRRIPAASNLSSRSQPSSRSTSRHPTPSPKDPPNTAYRSLTQPNMAPPQSLKVPPTAPSKRFGLFSKRSKTVPEVDQEQKVPRKGPAAGTGHEGYGKYAQRGRKSSIGSTGTRARSTSTSESGSNTIASYKSNMSGTRQSELDDFLRNRLEPVIISGGGAKVADVDMLRTGSNQSSLSSLPSSSSASISFSAISMPQSATPGLLVYDRDMSSPALNPAVLASSTMLQGATRTLADRRSIRRSQLFDGRGLTHPSPINTQLVVSPSSVNSYDTSYSSLPHTETSMAPEDNTLVKMDSKGSGKGDKPSRKLRWNFFQRSQDKKAPIIEPEPVTVTEMTATIASIPMMRPVAHYAMMDLEPEQSDTLEDLMQRIDDSPPKEEDIKARQPVPPLPVTSRQLHGQSILLPSPPSLAVFSQTRRPSSPRVQLHREPEPVKQAFESRPRLAQIGRIPRVVSSRDRQHRPAVQSFSRPFIRNEASEGFESDEVAEGNQPMVGIYSDVLPSRPFTEFDSDIPASAPAADIQRVIDPLAKDNAFLSFPRRKGSEVSASSSSGILSYAATTAVPPSQGSRPTEDEVWNEYDDLIDQVTSPISAPTDDAAFSVMGFPFPQVRSNRISDESNPFSRSLPVSGSFSIPATTSVILPPLESSTRSSASVRLRRSRILSALHSSVAPSTPMSVSELLAQYAEDAPEVLDSIQRQSSTSTGQASLISSHTRPSSITVSGSDEMNRQRNSTLMDMAERDRDGPIAQSNLRFGALMTSRWLSFGRVLFSPAHNEIRQNRQDRILVLDGLGNDDWSFYCAETYPGATVYSLSQVAPPPYMRNRTSTALQSPPNHRTVHHPNIGAPFPFPKGFFTVVIFRFPSAASDSALRSAICECRRVLRPGGYIELSVLDIDMLNMGNRTRRVVRNLRVRMAQADSEVSLKPAGDNLQRMLGRRGFENLNRCMVGVPVAGKIGTSDASANSRSSSLDIDASKNLSLNEMLKDPSPAGDDGITKMVSRVGRWWFTRCYEWGVLPDGDLGRSIWSDSGVMKECERFDTSFRLLIAYAQKPAETVRRTVSV